MEWIRQLHTLSKKDIALVGGKNASLGEMIQSLAAQGITVPEGFVLTSFAYREFLAANQLQSPIEALLNSSLALDEMSQKIRKLFLIGEFPAPLKESILKAYHSMGRRCDVAVRSSATAEDLPQASFAGQQESYLHIQGDEVLLESCKKCFASLFTSRAITYRQLHGFDHLKIALSVCVQRMVRSDKASSGVMFTLDPETGFKKFIVVTSSWGLGETVVQGVVSPDEYVIFKPTLTLLKKEKGLKEKQLVYRGSHTYLQKTPRSKQNTFSLTDEEALQLARWALLIENHYGCPMDIEWAKDGKTSKLYIVQARPETVHSQRSSHLFVTYQIKPFKAPIVKGIAVGNQAVSANVNIVTDPTNHESFKEGSILVSSTTSPDWVPLMKKASGIITDHGGRTSHAAIVSRELGIPAIVGTKNATQQLHQDQTVTIACCEGPIGQVYEGAVPFEKIFTDLQQLPSSPISLLINVSSPEEALKWWALPCQGIGLVRMEFMINHSIQIHPMALVFPNKVPPSDRKKIFKLSQGFSSPKSFFIDTVARTLAQVAATRFPEPVLVRFTDFKTNEYARLVGGNVFEGTEENPMLGLRGASRYTHPKYQPAFELECLALKKARDELGLTNIFPMIPFCRTLKEADDILALCASYGLRRDPPHLPFFMMAEIPSNIILAELFAQRFDGFSIGSNDLTQLTLGVDRDSEELSHLFDENNQAVKFMVSELIQKAHKNHVKVGICGQAPSDSQEFAFFLIQEQIDSISLNPDTVIPFLKSLRKTTRP